MAFWAAPDNVKFQYFEGRDIPQEIWLAVSRPNRRTLLGVALVETYYLRTSVSRKRKALLEGREC